MKPRPNVVSYLDVCLDAQQSFSPFYKSQWPVANGSRVAGLNIGA